jgi:hypothetical protein
MRAGCSFASCPLTYFSQEGECGVQPSNVRKGFLHRSGVEGQTIYLDQSHGRTAGHDDIIQRRSRSVKRNAMMTNNCCAECGQEEGGVVSLKTCKSCKLVKYCNALCQRNHWATHKKDCKRRAAELRNEALFKEPPAKEDCPRLDWYAVSRFHPQLYYRYLCSISHVTMRSC